MSAIMEKTMRRSLLNGARLAFVLVASLVWGGLAIPSAKAQEVSAADAEKIAADAYLYSYAMLYNYKTLFQQAMDPSFPGYIGGFNRFRHYSRGFTPADTDIVTPSNDTPYSWAWLDLRAEPMVVSVPASPDRYYVLQWFDLYTHNFAYLGSRATGTEAGDYLFVGPDWRGEKPASIKEVLRSETQIIGTLTRTAWTGPSDRDGLVAMQRQYRIRPLSEYLGSKPPTPAPSYHFPAWDEARATGIGFINYMNFILRFAPTVASEKETMERFAKIGIGAGRPFDPAAVDPAIRKAIEAGIKSAQTDLNATIAKTTSSVDLFGTRQFLGQDYVMRRAVGAAMGIYGNSKEEAYYSAFTLDADRKPLDGSKNYVLHFSKEQVPPVKYFWSMTMYNLPQRLLVDNAISRYAIGSRTEGLKTNGDGSVDIYLQNQSPGKDKESNWLPTPASGNYYMILRMYGPEGAPSDGKWQSPQPRLAQ
ncbi:MAG: DUF1254 domain-containing protein [Parvibaculaceae bacterium]